MRSFSLTPEAIRIIRGLREEFRREIRKSELRKRDQWAAGGLAGGAIPAIVSVEIPDASAGDGTVVTGGKAKLLSDDTKTQGDEVDVKNRTHARVPVNIVIYIVQVRGEYELLTVNCEPAASP